MLTGNIITHYGLYEICTVNTSCYDWYGEDNCNNYRNISCWWRNNWNVPAATRCSSCDSGSSSSTTLKFYYPFSFVAEVVLRLVFSEVLADLGVCLGLSNLCFGSFSLDLCFRRSAVSTLDVWCCWKMMMHMLALSYRVTAAFMLIRLLGLIFIFSLFTVYQHFILVVLFTHFCFLAVFSNHINCLSWYVQSGNMAWGTSTPFFVSFPHIALYISFFSWRAW